MFVIVKIKATETVIAALTYKRLFLPLHSTALTTLATRTSSVTATLISFAFQESRFSVCFSVDLGVAVPKSRPSFPFARYQFWNSSSGSCQQALAGHAVLQPPCFDARKLAMANLDQGLQPSSLTYWVRRASPLPGDGDGVVVTVAWMFSKRRHLEPYTRLYAASRFDSLVCHPHVLNLWFPSRAEALAVQILDELLKEVECNPRPIVFATFSGGAKACLYKIFQILQAEEAGLPYAGKYDTVKACVRGQIHDSSPVDFVSALGARFTSFSVSQRLGRSVYGLPAMSQAAAKLLDALFLPKFELQRADYWLSLKESSKLGPVLILCCTNDDLAPFDTINKFAMVVRESGCPVDLVVWDASDHVGHFRNYPKEYQAAVKTFLEQRLPFSLRSSSVDNTPSLVSSQDTSSSPRNLLLNSKL